MHKAPVQNGNLLLLVGCLRLRWDSNNDGGSFLHVFGGSHDERKQLAAFIPRLNNQGTNLIRASSQSSWFLVSFDKSLTEWTKARSRYLQSRVKARGFEKSFTSGVPYKGRSSRWVVCEGCAAEQRHAIWRLLPPWGNSRGRVPVTGWGWCRCNWLQFAGWQAASS